METKNEINKEFWEDIHVKEKIDLWHKYELIAMHFNELIIKFRIQALGGIAAISTLAGFVSNKNIVESYGFLFFVSLILTFAWIAIWTIDYFYYQKLLQGAVDAILDLEKQINQIKLSHKIEDRVKKICKRSIGPILFYFIIFLCLLFADLFFLCKI